MGKQIVVIAASLAAFLTTARETPAKPPDGREWKLAWHDEFDGKKLDETKWEYERLGKRRDGYWAKEGIALDGKGHLIIRTYTQDGKYYSGAISMRGKFAYRYGYLEARWKLPKEEGHWPALWVHSPTIGKTLDPRVSGTEIDIMEYHARWGDRCQHALHWNGYGKDHQSAKRKVNVPGLAEGFHTFGLEWTETEYVFYVDGKVTWRTDKAISARDEFVILSDEIGGWAGKIQNAKLPDVSLVDYVRLYKPTEKTTRDR